LSLGFIILISLSLFQSSCEKSSGIDDIDEKFGVSQKAQSASLVDLVSEPEAHNFGQIIAGLNEKSQIFTITNSSGNDLTIANFNFSADYFSLVSTTCPIEVGPLANQATCEVVAKFSADEEAAVAEDMTISYRVAGVENTLSVGLSGSVVTAASIGNSAITFDPETYDFGAIATNSDSDPTTISITNDSLIPIYFSSLSGGTTHYSINSDDCPRDPSPLLSGATCQATIQFSPTTGGELTMLFAANYGVLQNTSDYSASLGLTGTAVSALSFDGLQSINGTTHNQMTLNWNAVASAVGFNILKITASGNVLSRVVSNTSGTVTSTTLTELTPGTSYTYRVNAVDQLGSQDANVVDVTERTNANTAPTLTAIANPTVYSGATTTSIDANDSTSGNDTDADGDTITYTCKYDNSIDSTVSSSANDCSTLVNQDASNPSFSSSTGIFSGWMPRFTDEGVNFEFSIVAVDPYSGSDEVLFSTTIAAGVQLVTDISDTTTSEDVDKVVSFQISDATNTVACNSTYLSMTSTVTSLVANAGVTWGGTYPNCTATISPTANQNGSTTIKIILTSGPASDFDTFALGVSAVNDVPTISNISNQTTDFSKELSVSFTISDVEDTLSCNSSFLTMTSSDTALVPNTAVDWSGTGGNCTAIIAPIINKEGSSTITLVVTDNNAATANDTFSLDVRPPAWANLKAWFKADAGVTKDGSNLVSTWADQSDGGNDAIGVGAAQPTYVASGINGLPSLRGADSQLLTVSGIGTSWGSSEGSLFIVFEPDSDTQYGVLGFGNTGGFWRFAANGAGYFSIFRNTRVSTTPSSMPTTGTQLFSIRSDSGKYITHQNGAGVFSYTDDFTVPADLTIFKGNAGGRLTGDIAEILLYNSSVSEINRRRIECYLSIKYGITVTAHSCTNLRIEPEFVTASTNSSTTFSGYSGEPPYTYSIVSGGGSIDAETGVLTAPSSAATVSVRVMDAASNTTDATVLVEEVLPTDITGLQAWYDVSNVSTGEDGANIVHWPDLSGNDNHAHSPNTNYVTALTKSELNGWPTVRSTGAGRMYSYGIGTGWATSNASMIVVAQINTDTQYGIVDFSGTTSSFWREVSTGKGYFGPFLANRYNGKPNFAMPTTGTYVFSITSGAANYKVYLDGTEIMSESSDFGLSTDLQLFYGGSAQYLTGDIAEVLIYDTEISTSDREAMECYVGLKYNISTTITNSCP